MPLLPYQQADVESNDRFRWNCWARQTGKSFTKSLRRILRGLKRRRTQVFLSAGERQSRELMTKARQHCQALKIACDFVDARFFKNLSIRQLEIVLPGGVRVIALPANPQTARGYTGDVFLDEFAMHTEDRQIWAAMFPTLLRGGGELDVASTPKGKQNLFYTLQHNDKFSTSTVTLPQAVEQGLKVNVDEIRTAMGDEELFRQEFLCEFLDEATAFLTYDQIAACQDPLLRHATSVTQLAQDHHELYVGVDVGRKHDLTAIWILAHSPPLPGGGQGGVRKQAYNQYYTTAGLFELANVPFATQFALLEELVSLRQVRRCCIDAGGIGMQLAEQAVQAFGKHRVEAVTFTASLKSQMALALRIAVEQQRIAIPADERILKDWHSLERSVSATGQFLLSAPRGPQGHADRFWAAALALYSTQSAPGKIEAMPIRPIKFARQGIW